MTKGEILQLGPGPELDWLVAERVMGWTDGKDFIRYGTRIRRLDYGVNPPLPGDDWSPSTDIVAAWEVIKHLSDLGWQIGVYLEPGQANAVVELRRDGKVVQDTANDACVAISRAALLAVMGGIE